MPRRQDAGNERVEYVDLTEYLDHRLVPLSGTQVDTLFWCVGQHAVRYPTRIPDQEIFDHNVKHIESGQDPLRIVVEFCRDQGYEMFASLRMNDTHDATMGDDDTYKVKRDHPDWLVGPRPVDKPASFERPGMLRSYVDRLDMAGWYYTALDYDCPQVRDRFFAVVEEVCARYDVDGMELDFLTHPMYFSSSLQGRVADASQVACMTGFIRRIRQRMLQLADERGRALALAVRVPRTIEQGMFLGLDVQTWMQDRLIDIVVPGGRCCPLSIPVGDWVKRGHACGVQVYPSQGGFSCPERTCGHAMHSWSQGADGIYLFNFFVGSFDPGGQAAQAGHDVLCEIGDVEAIAHRDKLYEITPGGPERVWASGRHISQRHLPVELNPGKGQRSCNLPLVVGDELPGVRMAEMKMEFDFLGMTPGDEITIQVNGQTVDAPVCEPLAATATGQSRLTSRPGAPPLRQGENRLEVTLTRRGPAGAASTQPLVLDQVRMWVRYKMPGNG